MVRPYVTRSGTRVPSSSMSKHTEPEPSLSKRKPVKVTDPGLLNRTAWTNAAVALDHIKKVRIILWAVCYEDFCTGVVYTKRNVRTKSRTQG